jgi:sugar phosphate isomerase/epimerase
MTTLDRRTAMTAALAAVGGTATAAPDPAPGPPKFGLGLVTYNLAAKWDLPTLLKACRSTGIGAVEYRTTHAHGVEPTLDAAGRTAVKKQCADAGVVIWGCGTVCEFHSPDPAVVKKNVEDCKRFAQLVRDLGGVGVKVRPNGLVKGVPVEKTLAQIGEALAECGRAAANLGVEVWVEVHGLETQKPANMKAIMEACGHPAVGICWNSNGTDVADRSVAASFELLKKWIKSCHINEIYKDRGRVYPYRELFTLLRGIGYDRWTLIEVAKTPPDADSGTELLRYYKALWCELTGTPD